MGVIHEILKDIPIPKMIPVKQIFPHAKINDVKKHLWQELAAKDGGRVKPGMTVAVLAGSRGIANYDLIIKETVAFLKARGAIPFIVPAMGSHGGATAEGQWEVLYSQGITEELCGCEIRSGMDVEHICETDNGDPVFIDAYAAAADAMVVVNRIKPHTEYRGTYESGLIKMLAIGVSKQYGAEKYHAAGFTGFSERMLSVGAAVIRHCNVLYGIAIVDDPYDETCEVRALTGAEIITEEPELLKKAKAMMPRILFPKLDVLLIDVIGKNFSGEGMDPNITGRFAPKNMKGNLDVGRIAVLDISEESHGNGTGFGLADTGTRRAYEKFNFEMTYPNSLTSLVPDHVKLPMIFDNDKECIQAALKMNPGIDLHRPRMVRIKNTLHIEHIMISETLLKEAGRNGEIEILGCAEELMFNEQGNLF